MRGFLAHLWIAFAMCIGVTAVAPARAQPVEKGTTSAEAQFDVLVADAKATMLVDPVKTVEKAKIAAKAAMRLSGDKRTIGVATAEWLQGEAYMRIDQIDLARPLIDHALAAIGGDSRPSKLKGDVLLSKARIDAARADVAAALADYQQAHNIFNTVGETRSRAIALLGIALLYQEAKDLDNALRYYKQALDVYSGDPQLLLSIYNNRGDVYNESGRYAEAEGQFREALKLARTMDSPALQAPILRNLARNQLLENKFAEADKTIAEGFRLKGDGDNQDALLAVAAQAALQHGDLAKAQGLIARSFAAVDTTKTTLAFREAHETAYKIYKKLGDDQRALLNLEALKRFDDQTAELTTSTSTALMAARFDYANQELRIAKLKQDELQRSVDYEKANARIQRMIFIGIAVVTVVIVSMLVFGLITIRKSRNEVRAANIDLAATNTALAKALAAKTEFLATTSHEIRTPLNGILGMTQVILADRGLDAQMRDRLNVVQGAGISMRALVDDILDVAKMETGNMTIERVPMDLRATMRDVSRLWEDQARGRGVDFILDLAECPHFIEGDAARLRQVTFNLLSNALKFTDSGEIELRIASEDTDAGPRLRISVRDTGIGIPAEKLEEIFESFRQVDAGTTRRFGGTGLGLAICRNLARAMDGDVIVQSEWAVGSTFTIDMPLVCAAPPEADAAPDGTGASTALLIVDRNPISRSMLRTMLQERAGGPVRLADSIEAAIAFLSGSAVATILIDDATVKATGDPDSAIADIARASRDGGARCALMWSSPDEQQKEAFSVAGINMIIAKPIAGVALAETLFPCGEDAKKDGAEPLVTRAA